MSISTETARIYVACLASYNAGILHGRWIDCSSDASVMQSQVNKILADSPIPNAEEWAIHDCEGFAHLDEYEDLEVIAERVGHWKNYGQEAVEAYEHWFGKFDAEDFEDRYEGSVEDHYEDRKNFACDQFAVVMLSEHTEQQRDTFWAFANEERILRWCEDWCVFVSSKAARGGAHAEHCYIFRIDF